MSRYILGIDVGGTKIQAGLVDAKNRVVKEGQWPLNRHDKKTALGSLLNSAAALFNNQVAAIGIGITGLVDSQHGLSIASPNLPDDWQRVPLKKILEKKFKRPVYLENDANAIALAEAVVGAGRKYRHVLAITLGTGIGAGLVIDKKIYRGAFGAVELGHTVISDSSPLCSCRRRGHFEALVSGRAMKNLYRQYGGRPADSRSVEEKAIQGDRLALKTLKKISDYLSVGLANAIHTYNPEIIVLGGGLAKVSIIIKPALRSLPEKLIFPQLNQTKIAVSQLKYQAGVIGAALITKSRK